MGLRFLLFLFILYEKGVGANLPPVFTKDMNHLALSENTPVGQIVYNLEGHDPEGLPVTYSLVGTDRFIVNPTTGEVTLAEPLDREVNETLKFMVSIEDIVEGLHNNIVKVPVSVIVLDENDNAPEFKNSPYEADILENAAIGTTVISEILIEDRDSLGETLEVGCIASAQWSEACGVFEIVTLQSSQSQFKGFLVLKAPLNYNIKHSYQFQLYATDGHLNSTAGVEVRVVDIQNLPPTFVGSLATVLSEDAPIGTLALTVHAKDGDRAQPRNITYDLLTNPHDYFILDSVTGDLKTGKPLDRESLVDTSAPLNLTIRAREIVDDRPVDSNITTTLATVTITIRDVNDEPPRFNRKEYSVEIPENIPFGTPLPNLDMVVTDTDVGSNSAFSLRLSDVSGAFIVEPQQATGSTQVSIRLTNITLDYENPNQRKFIILVIAEELYTTPRLSSTATVTVTVTDVNDNAPTFKHVSYSAVVSEQATPGTHVLTITAIDRDHSRFGTEGIVYELFGNGAELFTVDNRTGVITVAFCATPGENHCLDFETKPDFFLNYKATDDDGSGQNMVVPLKISLYDTNDNAPEFLSPVYVSSIDEGALKFDPELIVQAVDPDKTSVISYSLVEGLNSELFSVDSVTGKIGIQGTNGLDMTHVKEDHVTLIVQASDGIFNTTCRIEIVIKDVNNNAPIFEMNHYNASVSEDAPIGTDLIRVVASDMDSGMNSEIKYSIQKGAFEDFAIEKDTGRVTIASKLDYDRRNTYQMQIIAVDQGTPSLTGTTMLTVVVLNANDKSPYFSPQTQRAEVSVDAEIGTVIHKLTASDPDVLSFEDLKYDLGFLPITAVDKNGKQVQETSVFRQWFQVEEDGSVKVVQPLDRNIAAVVTLPVNVVDTSATSMQISQGVLIITIVDVNSSPPSFRQLRFTERLVEEQPPNTTLATFHATDVESSISHYAIDPPNQYFQIDNVTGIVRSTQRIDYERVHQINFTVVAYDTGVPQLSTSVGVTVNVVNINDEEPVFDEATMYEAVLEENSPAGALVLTVHATDKDQGVFGEIRYSISGEQAELFTMDVITGELKVASGAIIDREVMDDIWLQAMAVDNAPVAVRKTASVPVHIKIKDLNDNSPVFGQRTYKASVAENLSLNPPAPILQVRAEDKDSSLNGQIKYTILDQTLPGAFSLDETTGVLYPSLPLSGNTSHHLKVSAVDRLGAGPHSDTAFIDINVDSVNQHSPEWVTPAKNESNFFIPENAAQADIVLMTVKATDQDLGENGRVTYYLKVGNKNVHETKEFTLDEISGELRTKVFLDREQKDEYQLVLVATDQGSPSRFESVRFINVYLNDSNDNKPQFPKDIYEFTVSENQPPSILIGTVKAIDKDTGDNGKVYYHIIDGNQKGMFSIDRTQGSIRTNYSLDREDKDEYTLTIYASNELILNGKSEEILNSLERKGPETANDTKIYKTDKEKTITQVEIRILDENDNPPSFEKEVYYAGVKSTAKSSEPILSVKAKDPDFEANGTISYFISASNLYKFDNVHSSGSIVPSPFNITQEGLLLTADFMAEYNQDRFVLNIMAQETQPPYRQTNADVHIWVVTAEQLVRIVFSSPCTQVNKQQSNVVSRLSNATRSIIVLDAIKHYVHPDYKDWCDVHMHVVDPLTSRVLPVERVIEMIDGQYDHLKDLYEDTGIKTLEAASTSNKTNQESFDPALAALIAILIVLFTGIVTFIVVCSCLKQWVLPMPAENGMVEKGSVRERSRRLLQELSSTDNPLWAEHKLRLYEEQELTMNVFGENNDGYPQSQDLPPVDNTYATIQGSGERDYATLNAPRSSGQIGNASLSSDSHMGPNNISFEAMLGFQGSTFQPELPATPEPPPRSNHFQN
ncbi:cadherin 87A [Arctopsyche grandis]|uniref:cadherin 87A n=1 Tax=Arctopsyche grandis TaxID=121162 RepID=UPI00406D9262